MSYSENGVLDLLMDIVHANDGVTYIEQRVAKQHAERCRDIHLKVLKNCWLKIESILPKDEYEELQLKIRDNQIETKLSE